MAVVDLQTLWLNSAASPADSVSFPALSELQVTPSRTGEVRRYSAGRMRAVVQVGLSRAISATLLSCDRDQLAWIESHIGQPVCVRDDRGRKLWAVYFAPVVTEHAYNTDCDVTLALSEVSWSEGV